MKKAKLKNLSVFKGHDGRYELRAEWSNDRHQCVYIMPFDNIEDRLRQFADLIQRDREEGLIDEGLMDGILIEGYK